MLVCARAATKTSWWVLPASVICGLGIAASFAFASYDPMSSCRSVSNATPPPTRTVTTSLPSNPLGKVLAGRSALPCVRYHLGTPQWAVAAAYAAPSVGGIVFGVVVLVALTPKVRARWRSLSPKVWRAWWRFQRIGTATRIFLAALVCGLAVAGAVAFSIQARAPWRLPVALLIGFVGVGASGALLASGRRS
jgi:hypothetical protein